VLVFIDIEHTQKNIMIRAFFDDNSNIEKVKKEYEEFKSEWQVQPYIEEAFGKILTDKLNK